MVLLPVVVSVKMVVHNLFIILSLDYLQAVAIFFLQTHNAISQNLKAAQTAAAATRLSTGGGAGGGGGGGRRGRNAIVAVDVKPVETKPTSDEPSPDINVLFSMDNPEVILVEDSMNPNTNALMLNVNIMYMYCFHLVSMNERQQVKCALRIH